MTDRMNGSAKVDRGRHPALFQRVSRSAPPKEEAAEPRPEPAGFHPPAFHRDQYRQALRAEAERIFDPAERAEIQAAIAEVDEALYHRHYARARAILESRLGSSPLLQTRCEARTQNLSDVLDRLCEAPGSSAIPEHLSRYDGRELLAGTVTVLANVSVPGRLADLCSRLVTALETRPDQSWIVVCREFSEEVIVLGLIAHITRRMTTAQGLTFAEIQARLKGCDPLDGYGDKPWLVDEAVDRLRRWTDSLQFVTNTADAPLIAETLERIADRQTLGGVFFDGLLSPRLFRLHADASVSAAGLLRELAGRLSCAVVAVTDPAAEEQLTFPTDSRSNDRRTPEPSPTVGEFREMLLYWIEQEERQEIRVA